MTIQTNSTLHPGVISREGLEGGAPLVKISVHLEGLSPPKILALAKLFRVCWPCFQSAMINCGLLCGYWGISYCGLYYISIKINYHVSIFENMGVVVAMPHPKMWAWLCLETPLLKLLEITTAYIPQQGVLATSLVSSIIGPLASKIPSCAPVYSFEVSNRN